MCIRPRFWSTGYTNGPKLFFNHLRSHKFINRRFRCTCSESFNDNTKKMEHVKSYHWGWVTCPYCPTLVENHINVRFHVAKKHKEIWSFIKMLDWYLGVTSSHLQLKLLDKGNAYEELIILNGGVNKRIVIVF